MEKYEELFVSIRRIIRAIDLRSKKLSKEAGITGPQLLVLQELERIKGITAKEVATNINLSQPTVTSILDRLEIKQFVNRVRSESDRRRVALFLTDDGAKTLLNAPKPIEESFVEKFSALKEWEQCNRFIRQQFLVKLKMRICTPQRGKDRLHWDTQAYKITIRDPTYRLVYQVRKESQEIAVVAISHLGYHHLW